MDVIGEARRIIPKCSPVSDGVFLKYIFGPRGAAAKWLFFLLTTRLSICLPPDTGRSLSGRRGRSPNADNCSLHSSSGAHPGHSIIIQLFLDKPTQINIYSCLQVRGLYEEQGARGTENTVGETGRWKRAKGAMDDFKDTVFYVVRRRRSACGSFKAYFYTETRRTWANLDLTDRWAHGGKPENLRR